MSKTFREDYYDGINWGKKKNKKNSNKKKRFKVKDYLRQISLEDLENIDKEDIEFDDN